MLTILACNDRLATELKQLGAISSNSICFPSRLPHRMGSFTMIKFRTCVSSHGVKKPSFYQIVVFVPRVIIMIIITWRRLLLIDEVGHLMTSDGQSSIARSRRIIRHIQLVRGNLSSHEMGDLAVEGNHPCIK